MKRELNCIILFFILTAIVLFIPACKERQDTTIPLEVTNPEGLFVATQNELFDLRYDLTDQRLEKVKAITVSDLTDIVVCGHSIYASSAETLRAFDPTFNELKLKTLGRVGAVATDGRTIFVAVDGSFISLNEELEELDRVKLEFEGPVPPDKNAHDIQIHNNTAYLLDNIMGPLFLFRVDIQNPQRMRITERILFQGINAHLHGQWLHPDLHQWMVIQSYGHKGGAGKNVHIYPLDEGKDPIGTTSIFSHTVVPEKVKQGYDMKGVTGFPPVWAVVQNIEDRYYLARVSSEDNHISFSNFLKLDIEGHHQEIIIKRKGNYLFVAPKFGNRLWVIDIEEVPELRSLKDLQEFNIRAVVDLVPY